MSKSSNYKLLHDFIIYSPFTTINNAINKLHISKSAISTISKNCENAGILYSLRDKKRYKLYYYKNYIDILSKE